MAKRIESENIREIDGITVLKLYDGNWHALFSDYRAKKTAKMECYSISSFNEWCDKNSLIGII